MITSLHITNFALIDQLDVEFGPGLNIITGETGAGKSVIMTALSLLLGGRPRSDIYTDASRRIEVEGVFTVDDNAQLAEYLERNGLPCDNRECVLRRYITPTGANRAYINDEPVKVADLQQVAPMLVDMNSQFQNLMLAEPTFQLSVIDAMADNEAILKEYREAYGAYRALLNQYTVVRDAAARDRNELDYMQYQLQSLAELQLQPGEVAALEHERDLLANVGKISEALSEAAAMLDNDSSGAVMSLATAAVACRSVGNLVGEAPEMAERLEALRIEAQDVAETIDRVLQAIDADPNRLDYITKRLDAIYTLTARHRLESPEKLIVLRDDLKRRIDAITNSDNLLSELEDQARHAKRHAMEIAARLTESRQTTAKAFAMELQPVAASLGMRNLRCDVSVETGKLGPDGRDTLTFLFAINKNQELTAATRTASGGEKSRLMLAIKTIMAKKLQVSTIVFDEIDTGVSGEIAAHMGQLMQHMGEHLQVIAITHLPQIAALGSQHFKVYKVDDEQTTRIHIKPIGGDERIAELAQMLSGAADDPDAIATAKSMLNRASNQ